MGRGPARTPPAARAGPRRPSLRRGAGRLRARTRARLSPAHFSREFARAFGETPHRYLLTRRLERAAALLRTTDRSVADICMTVGLRSVGSFTTSFGRMYGLSPTVYRATYPPASDRARVPTCVLRAWGRPWTARPRA
jgi:AraC-like DNA-binding protein